MSGQLSRGSAGEYQADERQEVRERLTRGTEPTGRGSHLSLHRVPAAGSAQGRRPTARIADDISRDVTTDDMTAYDRRLYTTAAQDLIIDDLGSETLRSNYGLVGNSITALNARYGERVTDRLVEMFLPVRLTGRNWRRDNG